MDTVSVELIKMAIEKGKNDPEILSGIVFILARGDKARYEAIIKAINT